MVASSPAHSSPEVTIVSDELEEVALRKVLYGISGCDADDNTPIDAALAVVERIEDLEEENKELRGRLVEIENRIEVIQNLGSKKTTKEEKVAAIVQYAQNTVGEEATTGHVPLKPKTVKGVAGVTERYAYKLLDDLPDEYDFFLDKTEIRQYGDSELDKDSQERALVVDLEVLHQDEHALNKFNNGTTSGGVEA